jgi:hypothetical protein
MCTPPSLSSYILSALAGVLLATGVFDNFLGLITADQFLRLSPQSSAEPAPSRKFVATDVNRSRKGDRLSTTLIIPSKNTSIIQKSVALPVQTDHGAHNKPALPRIFEIDGAKRIANAAPSLHCETPARDNVVADSVRFIERCYV